MVNVLAIHFVAAKVTNGIKITLLLLIIFFTGLAFSIENATGGPVLNTPAELLKYKIQVKQDAVHLLKSERFEEQIFELAKQVEKASPTELTDREEIALTSILNQNKKVLDMVARKRYPLNFYHFSLYAKALRMKGSDELSLNKRLIVLLSQTLSQLTGDDLHNISNTMSFSILMSQDYMFNLFQYYKKKDVLTLQGAIDLVSNFQLYKVYERVLPTATRLIAIEQNKRYVVDTNVLVKTPDGASISTIVVRKRGEQAKRPTAFQFTIYTDFKSQVKEAMHAAAHGYVGVIANTRGKGNSPDTIVPWEHDGEDANAVIDWIANQSWSDGRVAMYGGSYLGFTQWAAAKYHNPALKTIVPYEAAHPFVGLPVENNIFITPNYQWAFHVTNNKTMDNSVYSDWKHWDDAFKRLFQSGRAFKEIDKVEGTPNPWFQKWLSHPSYDSYYQAMLPYKEDYKNINIPVLSITGYFGASISAVYFFTEHHKFNKNADHSLLIGPYNHGTAQGIPRSYHSNYKLDPVALDKDTKEITFQWFDHVLFNKPKPKLIQDTVNYQLMGSNTWQHKPSLEAMNQQATTFYLSNKKNGKGQYQLTQESQKPKNFVALSVDLSDRKIVRNKNTWHVLEKKLGDSNGLIFISQPFKESQELAGFVTGHFNLAINKRDVDIGFILYQVKPNGETFKLTRYISRASYANDMRNRQLLTPNQKTIVPIVNSTMTAKLIEKGSRLAIVLNVNKNSGAQVNMGTGKNVSDETIEDAGDFLEVKWFSDSEINIPLRSWK